MSDNNYGGSEVQNDLAVLFTDFIGNNMEHNNYMITTRQLYDKCEELTEFKTTLSKNSGSYGTDGKLTQDGKDTIRYAINQAKMKFHWMYRKGKEMENGEPVPKGCYVLTDTGKQRAKNRLNSIINNSQSVDLQSILDYTVKEEGKKEFKLKADRKRAAVLRAKRILYLEAITNGHICCEWCEADAHKHATLDINLPFNRLENHHIEEIAGRPDEGSDCKVEDCRLICNDCHKLYDDLTDEQKSRVVAAESMEVVRDEMNALAQAQGEAA